jgi:tetratricopeptide (TPR) repeat protein
MKSLSDQAIAAVFASDWKKAIRLDRKTILQDPNNLDALTRLTRSYLELGQLKLARNLINKAKRVSPNDPIVQRLIQKLVSLTTKSCSHVELCASTMAFIEKDGQTRTYRLDINKNTTEALKILPGEYLILNPQGFCLSVLSTKGRFIGRFDGLTSQRLKKEIAQKGNFQAVVKATDSNFLEIVLFPKN